MNDVLLTDVRCAECGEKMTVLGKPVPAMLCCDTPRCPNNGTKIVPPRVLVSHLCAPQPEVTHAEPEEVQTRGGKKRR